MTQQQFIEEIKQLSVAERIALIEAISRSVREELQRHEADVSIAPAEIEQPTPQDATQAKVPLSQWLYGIAQFDGEPPTDEEVKNAYADYLLEKYS